MYIYKAGVVGAGTMGAEIAQVISYSGLPVVLKDVNEAAVQKGMDRIRSIYQRRVDKGRMSASEMQGKMALVTLSTEYESFSDVDIVVEAVPEKMDLKKKIFSDLDRVVSEGCILATNTSALSISEMASVTRRPQKFIGMHFFFPASIMKLVEVIPSKDTTQETIDDVVLFSESLRKIPVRVNECAGFLVNRLLMPYLNEAAFCLQEQAASREQIDQACIEFGLPMGPFTLVDQLGLDICYDVVQTLLAAYGDRMQPAEIWGKLHAAGYLGKKTGAGFYIYDTEKADRLTEWLKEIPAKKTEFSIQRLIFPMINEAILSLQENISSAGDIDLAMAAGIGFPQDKGGPLRYADEIGLDRVLKELEELTEKHGKRFAPAARLKELVRNGNLGRRTGRGFHDYG